MLYFNMDKNKSGFSLKPFQAGHLLCHSDSDLYQYFFRVDVAYELGVFFFLNSHSSNFILFFVVFFINRTLERVVFKINL